MQVARSGGPKRALPWSPKRILPERPRPGNPPGPLLDGERLHAEEVPERGGVGCVAYPVEEGEQAYDIPDRGEESSRQPHREERRVENRDPLVPGSREARVGLVEGAGVGPGELVATLYIPLKGSDGGAGHVVGGDPGRRDLLASWHEGHESAQRQEQIFHEHRGTQDGVGEHFGSGELFLEACLLPELSDVPR